VKRVVTVIGRCGPGRTCGAERMADLTAQALRRAGHQVEVVGPGEPWPSWRPDVVHGYDLADPQPVAAAQERAARLGVPFVLTPASTRDVWPDHDLGIRLCRTSALLFTLTRHEAGSLRGLGCAHVRALPQAPDLAGPPDPAGFRARYGIDGGLVLFVGRRLVSKGFPTLVEAVPEVLRRCPGTKFAFLGPGDPVTGGVDVVDLGMVDDKTKHDAIAACTVLCLPTNADLFPLVFVEAWACGKPVISSAFPGVTEVVRDGVDGLVVAQAPAPVADALVRLLDDAALCERLGKAGQKRVHAEMGWHRVADVVARGYREVGVR